jgi:hypothetical protein
MLIGDWGNIKDAYINKNKILNQRQLWDTK